jgi:hypothetical protein
MLSNQSLFLRSEITRSTLDGEPNKRVLTLQLVGGSFVALSLRPCTAASFGPAPDCSGRNLRQDETVRGGLNSTPDCV